MRRGEEGKEGEKKGGRKEGGGTMLKPRGKGGKE